MELSPLSPGVRISRSWGQEQALGIRPRILPLDCCLPQHLNRQLQYWPLLGIPIFTCVIHLFYFPVTVIASMNVLMLREEGYIKLDRMP